MFAVLLIITGVFVFAAAVAVEGLLLRRRPDKEHAETFSRSLHFLFFAALGIPVVVAFFSPGLTHLDALVGLDPLPYHTLFLILGVLLAVPGMYLMVVSNRSLRVLGSGANAFKLTRRVVEQDIYQRTRNPMSLGYYMLGLSIAFLAGSTFLTLIVLLGIIPAHLFFLKYFEELELELRFGEAYRAYKQQVPFLFPKLSSHPTKTSI